MAVHLALLIFWLAPARYEAAPPPLPTIDEVLTRLDRTEAAIDNLSVTTRYVSHNRFFEKPDDEPVRVEMTTKFVVDRDGRSWYECEGEQASSSPQRKTRKYKGRWSTAFDGKTATSLTSGADGKPNLAVISDYPSWHGVNPLEYTTRYFQESVASRLRKEGDRVVEWQTRQSRPVVVADGKVFTDPKGQGWKLRFWIDMERGVVVRRAGMIRLAPEKRWREYTRIESDDHKEVAPGIWLPMRFLYESVDVAKDNEDRPERFWWRYEGVNFDWAANKKLPEGLFRLTFPDDVEVNDHRAKKPPAEAKPPVDDLTPSLGRAIRNLKSER